MARTVIVKVLTRTSAPVATWAVARSAGFRVSTVRIPSANCTSSKIASTDAGRWTRSDAWRVAAMTKRITITLTTMAQARWAKCSQIWERVTGVLSEGSGLQARQSLTIFNSAELVGGRTWLYEAG